VLRRSAGGAVGGGEVLDGVANVLFLDTSTESVALSRLFATQENLTELLETVSPVVAGEDDLKAISYLVGKDYESCCVYELDDFADQDTVPYFKAKCGGATYGSESMGLGELSLHLLYWQLKRITPRSILLWEEPETYVSFRSQTALLNILAKICDEKAVWAILTTHSAGILSQIPPEHVKIAYRSGAETRVIENPSDESLRSLVGIESSFDGLFVLEDEVAAAFAIEWISHIEPQMLHKYDFVVGGSEADLIEIAKRLPRLDWLKTIFVFDGDVVRGDTINRIIDICSFLPGASAPEELLRASVSANGLANRLGIKEEEAAFALSELQGSDHHDWLNGLAARLKVARNTLIKALYEIWLSSGSNAEIAKKAFADLRLKLGLKGA
jgi:hypothetical protein